MSLIDKQAVTDKKNITGITFYTSHSLVHHLVSAHDAMPWVLAFWEHLALFSGFIGIIPLS